MKFFCVLFLVQYNHTRMTIQEARTHLRQVTAYLSVADRALVEQAVDTALQAHATQVRSDGSLYATHPLAVALILAEWHADAATIVAGLLHDTLEDTKLSLGDIRQAFGSAVAGLVEGVTKFTAADFAPETLLDRKVETLRKLFEVMRRDIRVVIIKLADRLHNVRTINTLPEEQRRRFAKETITIYYKLAYHLGMNNVRREFSEYCLPYVYPEEVATLRLLREEALAKGQDILSRMQRELRARDEERTLVTLELHARSFYSMRREREEEGRIKQGFVIIAIASDSNACYVLLRLLHSLYHPVSSEFHDHIAAPTESAYQTIRTAVLGPGNEFIPLRIRTVEMQEQERWGILLRFFGEKGAQIPGFSWLQRSEELDRSTRESSNAFWEALQSDIFQETVNVIVDGKDIHLPRKATVLDAIYTRHGKDTHRTVGVRVNGVSAALADPLTEDTAIQTTFDTVPHVSFDWLGSIETAYARQCIVEALKERDRSEKQSIGQRLLQKELDHHQQGALADVSRARLRETAAHFHREEFEAVLTLIGEGVLLAQDVVFALFPEQRQGLLFLRGRKTAPHHFRIHLTGTQEKTHDILPKFYALARLSEVAIGKTDLRANHRSKTFGLFVSGTTSDRLHFGDFLTSLERQSWISHVRALISLRQKEWLVAAFSLAFTVVLLDLLLLPWYSTWFGKLRFFPDAMLQALPLLPIFVVNSYLLRLLRHHVVRMRTDWWFVGVGFILNAIGLLATIGAGIATGGLTSGLLPLVAFFILSMMYLGYRFFQTEALFQAADQKTLRPLTKEEWRARVKQKVIGYGIRLCAVTIWGFQPLYLKYTPANTVDPFVQLYLMSLGATVTTALLIPIWKGIAPRRHLTLRIPRNFYLGGIIVGQALFLYFISASLLYTTSTNFALLSNFSPVFALLVAALFWRRSIPYLRDPRHMLWIFLIFMTGSTGGSLIIYHSLRFASPQTILGDVLALCAMAADVLVITSQIRYVKLIPKASSLSLNLHMFGPTTLALTPPILYLLAARSSALTSLTPIPILFSLGVGVMLAVGMVCNFEAFRRIDGFIAFLMFNLSILINFVAEAFFLKTIVPTWTLIVGGTIIISSTILAESVNSRCEKQGL